MKDTPREARRKARLASSLQLQTIPNLNDSRNAARANKVVDLAYDILLGPGGKRAIRATDLCRVIGNPSRYPGTYFRTIFRAEGLYGPSQSYTYRVVPHRLERLAKAIGRENGLSAAARLRGYNFRVPPGRRADLPRTGDRVYPWWALMKSAVRTQLFLADHGCGFDYDIEAAKSTVTLQAWRSMMETFRPAYADHPYCQLPTWTALVVDRTAFRMEMGETVGISNDHAKFVCQAILNGGWASPHAENSIRQLIGHDATVRLLNSTIYRQLRDDFQIFYAELKEIDAASGLEIIKPGQTAGQAISALYNRIEDEIMGAVDKFFAGTVDVWFIHDGFITRERISRPGLEAFIKEETGYLIRFDEKEICKP